MSGMFFHDIFFPFEGQIAEEKARLQRKFLILEKAGRILRQEWSRQKSPSSSLPVNFTSGSSGAWMAPANPREIPFLDSFPVSGRWRKSGGGGRASVFWMIYMRGDQEENNSHFLLALRRFIWGFFRTLALALPLHRKQSLVPQGFVGGFFPSFQRCISLCGDYCCLQNCIVSCSRRIYGLDRITLLCGAFSSSSSSQLALIADFILQGNRFWFFFFLFSFSFSSLG